MASAPPGAGCLGRATARNDVVLDDSDEHFLLASTNNFVFRKGRGW